MAKILLANTASIHDENNISCAPARISRGSVSRDCEDGRATGQPQDLVPEPHLNSTVQDEGSEDGRKDAHTRGLLSADS